MKTVLIVYTPFGRKENFTMLNVINHGTINNNIVSFTTNKGDINEPKEVVSSSMVKVINEDEVNIKNSLHYWYYYHQGESNKPLVKDDLLEVGEDYLGSGWHYKLRLLVTSIEIRYKILLV